jgi:hypothetical protein
MSLDGGWGGARNFCRIFRSETAKGPVGWHIVIGVKEVVEIREYGRGDPRGTLNPQKLALTSPTNGSRSVGVVRSLTQDTEFSFLS